MWKPMFAATVAAIVSGSPAQAANTSLSIIFNSPPSTALSCVIQYPNGQASFAVPVAVGTVIAACSVQPSGWSGALTTSGPDAASFSLNGMNLVAGSAGITIPKTYNVTLTATP